MKYLIAIIVIFLSHQAFGTSYQVIGIPENATSVDIGTPAYFFEDKDHKLTIDDLRSMPAEKMTFNNRNSISFSFSKSTYWLRFSLQNQSDKARQLLIKLNYPMMDQIALHQVNGNGSIHTSYGGDIYPFESRHQSYRNFLFPTNFAANETKTYFLKVRSTSTLTVPLTIETPWVLEEDVSNEKAAFALYFGCMLAILIYNLFVFLSTRSKAYISYVFFLATSISFYLAWTGIGNQFVWSDSQWLTQRAWGLSGCFLAASIYLFQYYFLDIRQSLPRMNRFYQFMVVINLLGAVVASQLPWAQCQQLGFMAGLSCAFISFGIAIYLLVRKRQRQAFFFVVAWSAFLCFIGYGALVTVGVISVDGPGQLISSFGSQIGSAMEALLLSFGLADRINVMKAKELEQSQKIIENLGKIQVLKDRLEAALSATKKMSEEMKKDLALKAATDQTCKQLDYLSIKHIVYYELNSDNSEFTPQSLFRMEGVPELSPPLRGNIRRIKREENRILAPISWKDHTFGIFTIQFDNEVETIPEEDMWFIETMMQSLALALQNIFYQDNLKDLVEERTAELGEALKEVTERQEKVDDILENIEQGIITFDSDFNLGDEYSKHLLKIFNISADQMKSLTIDKLLFDNATMSEDKQQSAMESLKSCVDVIDYLWEANTHHLPSQIIKEFPKGTKYIDLEWKPLTHGDDTVDQVMVVAKDVTATMALEAQLAEEEQKQKEFMEVLTKLVSVDKQVLDGFFSEIQKNINAIRKEIEGAFNETFIFRSLHTMKGLSRSLRLDTLSETIHHTEGLIVAKHEKNPENQKVFIQQFEVFESEFAEYLKVYDQVFGIHVENLQTWNLIQFVAQVLPERLESIRAQHYPIGWFKCSDHVMNWNVELINDLRDILMHMFNNSIDHGYLIPFAAEQEKRPIHLEITSEVVGDKVLIVMEDFGAGINVGKLQKKAEELNKEFNPENPFELIFHDGVSTTEKATLTSGRGVGMAAVKGKLEDLGGSIKVTNKENGGTKFEILIPTSLAFADLSQYVSAS